jgi:hypothetical protein
MSRLLALVQLAGAALTWCAFLGYIAVMLLLLGGYEALTGRRG